MCSFFHLWKVRPDSGIGNDFNIKLLGKQILKDKGKLGSYEFLGGGACVIVLGTNYIWWD